MPDDQPTVESLTDPFILTFTPPPVIGPGICDICHGSPNHRPAHLTDRLL
jgi:hypothetical protein